MSPSNLITSTEPRLTSGAENKLSAKPIATKNPSPSRPPITTTQMIQRRLREGVAEVTAAPPGQGRSYLNQPRWIIRRIQCPAEIRRSGVSTTTRLACFSPQADHVDLGTRAARRPGADDLHLLVL